MKAERKRSTERAKEMREVLSELEDSGESVKTFCERKHISTWAIYHWRRRLREGSAGRPVRDQQPALLPIRVIDGKESELAPYEIGLRSGRTIKVKPGFSSSELERLLQVLEQC